MAKADSLQRIDQFVCDVKDSQFTSGLHIFGRSAAIDIADIDGDENAHAERHGMACALAGKSVLAGPLPAHPIGDGQIFYLPAESFCG